MSWISMVLGGGKSLPPFRRRALGTTAVAVIVYFLHLEYRDELLPDLTPQPFVILGLPLGIFLGFRNSAAYDRFWEARKLWGELVNSSRTWARQATHAVPAHVSDSARSALAIGVAVLAHGLRAHLRQLEASDAVTLMPADMRTRWQVWSARSPEDRPSVPLFALMWMSQQLHQLRQSDAESSVGMSGGGDGQWVIPFEQTLTTLSNVIGACERIRNTPIPYSYTVLMHRIVALYCTLLPMGLATTVKGSTPFVVFFVSYALFGLDAIGEEIEQPFGFDQNDLPLDRLCAVITRDVAEISGTMNVAPVPTSTEPEIET